MKITKLLFAFLFLTTSISCNIYFTKKQALRAVKKSAIKDDAYTVIEDHDRMVKVTTRDSNYQPLDLIYKFDKHDKQIEYTLIASCDSCFQKYLKTEMSKPFFKWKKLDDSTYISPCWAKSFLYIFPSALTFQIVQHHLSREECNSLRKIAVK